MAIKAGANHTSPRQESPGGGGESTDSGGGSGQGAVTVDAGQASVILTQLERGAKSNEARNMIESLRTGLGLN